MVTPVQPSIGGSQEAWACPTEGTDLPYVFVPIPRSVESPDRLAGLAESPVWHHGANEDEQELLSGELLCTITTLTPTLVGNQQVEWGELDPQWRHRLLKKRGREFPEPSAAKKVLFPLTDPVTSAVLWPGESMKGMVRTNIGALLAAPIERVNQATYSYRPNAVLPGQTPKHRPAPATIPVPAVVESFNAETLDLSLRVIDDAGALSHLEFVKTLDDPHRCGDQEFGLGRSKGQVLTHVSGQWVCRDLGRGRFDWIRLPNPKGTTTDTKLSCPKVWLNYQFGLSEDREFMAIAGKRAVPHPSVLMYQEHHESGLIVTVDPEVVRQYLQTLEHLVDRQHGHLSRLNHEGRAPRPRPIAKHDLIFCEWQAKDCKVISFGHNFRYRWRYLDSICECVIGFDEARSDWTIERRVEMRSHPDERPDAEGRPLKLTGERGTMGFVAVDGLAGLGGAQTGRGGLLDLKEPFNALAGRVSFNLAMERLSQNEADHTRFVNSATGSAVFLHPTLSPKSSFQRSYVPGQGKTWGDGLLRKGQGIWVQNRATQFAGRKFYVHQGMLKGDGTLDLPSRHFDLEALLLPATGSQLRSAHGHQDLVQLLGSDQAAIAVRMSSPGRQFGVAVRFKYLRRWELAALAAALDPGLLAEALSAEPSPKGLGGSSLEPAVKAARLREGPAPAFGNKLGHGRALGLGSVRVCIDLTRPWNPGMQDDAEEERHAADAVNGGMDSAWHVENIRRHLLRRLHPVSTASWLDALRLGRTDRRPYLLHQNGQGEPETQVGWAQRERKRHLEHSRDGGVSTGGAPGAARPTLQQGARFGQGERPGKHGKGHRG